MLIENFTVTDDLNQTRVSSLLLILRTIQSSNNTIPDLNTGDKSFIILTVRLKVHNIKNFK